MRETPNADSAELRHSPRTTAERSDEDAAEGGGDGTAVRTDGYSLDRRDVLRATAGAVLLGGAAGGAVSAETTGPVSADGKTVYIGSEDGAVSAVDAETGTQQWRFDDPDGPVISPPTAVEGTLYVGSGLTRRFVELGSAASHSDPLYAIDAETGDQEWAFDQPDTVFITAPTVVEGTVYIAGTNTDTESETLYAVDAETGEQEWAATDPPVFGSSSPNVIDGTVYAGSFDPETTTGILYALSADTGEQEWVYTDPAFPILSSPTVFGGTVYVGADGFHAVDAETGTREWFSARPGPVVSSPTVVGGSVYFGSLEAEVYAFDAGAGALEWTFSTSDVVLSSPTVSEGTVYVGSDDANLYAIDAETGEGEWTFDEPTEFVRSSPTVSDGVVYVGSNDGSLYAIDAKTGEREWAFDDLGATNECSPTVVADPESGDSVGSRVSLGTLGHTQEWASQGVARYTNEAGIVDTGSLRAAIGDWRDGVIGTALLREVIAAWQGG